MNILDSFLNRITMYRLLLLGLTALAAYAWVLSVFGFLSYPWWALLGSLVILWIACAGSEYILAMLFHRPVNIESQWITAFILFFTLAPLASVSDALLVALAGVLAIASKYILVIHKRHLFNPAAASLLIMTLAGTGLASWWVAAPVLLPGVAILGLLIVRKIHRFDALLSFVLAAAAVLIFSGFMQGRDPIATVQTLLLSWPLVFFGTIMLTEPFTMPPSRPLRIVYGVIVGALFSSQFHFGFLYATPQFALIMGNLYAYIVGSKQKLSLRFKSKQMLSPTVYEFTFTPDQQLDFEAGQYMEWTLEHKKPDARGNRRYFTVASAPHEAEVRLGARIGEKSSTFKNALMALAPGGTLAAGSVSGDFTLPKDASKKLVFIAGGIGITPFISMIRHMIGKEEKRNVTLLYAANTADDFAYKNILDEAASTIGLKVAYLAGVKITEETLRTYAPTIAEHTFYISGPEGMVRAYKTLLRNMGVPARQIKTDYFPGF